MNNLNLSFQIVIITLVCIFGGLGIGYLIDKIFSIFPIGILFGIIIGVFASIFGIYFIVKRESK